MWVLREGAREALAPGPAGPQVSLDLSPSGRVAGIANAVCGVRAGWARGCSIATAASP